MTGPNGARHVDAQHCAALVAEHARTFHAASRLLPAEKRRAVFALYAFCRVADDIVDRADGAQTASHQLTEFERQFEIATTGRPNGPVFRELNRAVNTYGVPEHALRELLGGVASDLRPARHATWASLARYCESVASSVAEMCVHVFGVGGGPEVRERAIRYARTLGVAMQLTNILRDVGEDARVGRCYLPADDLAAFGLTVDEVLRRHDIADDERWRPFMAFEVGRARALYEAARPGLALLSADAVRCATACATGYAGILDAIVANGYDTISTRARLGRAARFALLWKAWRGAAPVPVGADGTAGPYVSWDATWDVARERNAERVKLA